MLQIWHQAARRFPISDLGIHSRQKCYALKTCNAVWFETKKYLSGQHFTGPTMNTTIIRHTLSFLRRIIFSAFFACGRSFFQSFLVLVDYSSAYGLDKLSLYTYVTGGVDLLGCPLLKFTLALNSVLLHVLCKCSFSCFCSIFLCSVSASQAKNLFLLDVLQLLMLFRRMETYFESIPFS